MQHKKHKITGEHTEPLGTDTYPSPQAPKAVYFGFGGHEVVEAMGEGLLVLLGRLGVVGNSRG